MLLGQITSGEVLTAALMKIQVFRDVTPCRVLKVTDDSEEPTASIFRGKQPKTVTKRFRNVVTFYQSTWPDIPEDLNLQIISYSINKFI